MGCCCDYHEFNLDWLIEEIKKALSQWETVKNDWNNIKEFIENYFKNLDVQEEINNKIEELLNSGRLDVLLNEFIPYVTPEMYGAVGDGITDDTEAINACLSAAESVFFPSKKYAIKNTILIDVKGRTKLINFNNAEIIVQQEIENAFFIDGSDTSGSSDQSICNFKNLRLDCNNLAKIGIYDKSKLSIFDSVNILNAVDIALKIGEYGDDIASGASKYSNINIGRTNKNFYNTGIGLQIGNPDIQFTNINIARYQIGVDVQAGGCCFSNIHITAQFPSIVENIPDCYGFYFSTPVTYRNNTSIVNAYFDAVRVCIYSKTNTGMCTISNSFYLLDGNLFSAEKIIAYMAAGTYTNINVNNFTICGTTPKLNFRDRYTDVISTYDEMYNSRDYNREYYQITDIIDAGNLKGSAIIVSNSHPLLPNKYKKIGSIITPIINNETNYFYPFPIKIELINRDYSYLYADIIFDSSSNDFKIIEKNQYPTRIEDCRLFIKKGRNPVTINGARYNTSDIYIFGDFSDIITLKITASNNYVRCYVRSIPNDNDVFETVDNLQEITNTGGQ